MPIFSRLVLVFLLALGIMSWALKDELAAQKHPNQRPPAVLTEEGRAITLTDYAPAQLAADIAATDEKPLLLFVYTSWCPYCHKMFPLFNAEAARSDDMRFLAISTDRDRAALRNYLAAQQPVHVGHAIIADPFAQMDFIRGMEAQGLRFQGGIPFLAVFHHGKPIAEVPGALEKAEFDSMVQDIRDAVAFDANPQLQE
jgi:thiol-disulfide isomerase/thioredoxin